MRRKQKRTGAAAVEFAFVAPVVFLFVFAAFEFMRVSMLQSAADVASYEACREVIVPGAKICLLYTSPSPRDRTRSRMPSSA